MTLEVFSTHKPQTYGYITMSQAMQFTADFKLGQWVLYILSPSLPCVANVTVATWRYFLVVRALSVSSVSLLVDPSTTDVLVSSMLADEFWGIYGNHTYPDRRNCYCRNGTAWRSILVSIPLIRRRKLLNEIRNIRMFTNIPWDHCPFSPAFCLTWWFI